MSSIAVWLSVVFAAAAHEAEALVAAAVGLAMITRLLSVIKFVLTGFFCLGEGCIPASMMLFWGGAFFALVADATAMEISLCFFSSTTKSTSSRLIIEVLVADKALES